MATLEIAQPAEADFDAVLKYLSFEAGQAVSRKFGDSLLKAFDRLTEFPGAGAARPRLSRDVRIWTVEPYVVFYRYAAKDDIVRILRILHGKRKFTRKLLSGSSP